jgi:hypothetical protein
MSFNYRIELIKEYLYKPQPLNYSRVKGAERLLYEWLLKHKSMIKTEMYYSKDIGKKYVVYKFW